MRLEGWWLTGFVFAGLVGFVALALSYCGISEEGIRMILRGTARCSAVLFLGAFSASSAHFLLQRPWTAWLLRNRRYIGVSFAVSHAVHLLALVALGVWLPHPFLNQLGPLTLVKGGLGYAFIAAMAMTSFEPPKRWLGSRRWRLLHTVGAYYLWMLFARDYLALAAKHWAFAPFAGVMLLALALRVIQVVWRVRQKAADTLHTDGRRLPAHPEACVRRVDMIRGGMQDVRTALFWACGIALLVPVWMGTHFPSEDGFAHLAWTEVYRSLAAPNSPWASFYARSAQWNTPNLSYFLLQYTLGAVIEPHVAQRLIITVLMLSWVGAIHALSVQLTGALSLGALASLLLMHNSWLYGGYLSFLLGVPPLILALALVVQLVRANDSPKLSLYVALGVLGVMAYYCHLIAAGTFLLLVALACLTLVRGQPRRAAGLALAGLPAALLVLSFLVGGSFGTGGLRWEPPVKTVARFVGLAFFRGFASPDLGFWLVLGLFGTVLAVLGLDAARALVRRQVPPVGRFVLVLAVALVALYVVAPDGLGDGYNLKGRFQLVLWVWLLPGLPYALSRRTRALVTAGVALLLVWQIADFSSGVRRFNAVYDGIVARARIIPPGSTIARELDYGHAGFEQSFIRVLAHAPEDLAYHCGGVLIAGYHPSTPFYWVSTRSADTRQAQYHMQIRQLPGLPVTLTLVDWDGRPHHTRESAVGASAASFVASGQRGTAGAPLLPPHLSPAEQQRLLAARQGDHHTNHAQE